MDKKIRPKYMLPPRDPSQIERYTQTKSKGMEKDISSKWKGKMSWAAVLIPKKTVSKTKAETKETT